MTDFMFFPECQSQPIAELKAWLPPTHDTSRTHIFSPILFVITKLVVPCSAWDGVCTLECLHTGMQLSWEFHPKLKQESSMKAEF